MRRLMTQTTPTLDTVTDRRNTTVSCFLAAAFFLCFKVNIENWRELVRTNFEIIAGRSWRED